MGGRSTTVRTGLRYNTSTREWEYGRERIDPSLIEIMGEDRITEEGNLQPAFKPKTLEEYREALSQVQSKLQQLQDNGYEYWEDGINRSAKQGFRELYTLYHNYRAELLRRIEQGR